MTLLHRFIVCIGFKIKGQNINAIFLNLKNNYLNLFFFFLYSQAVSNIYKLLKTNGTCLMAFLITNPIYDIYLELSRSIKYMEYMYDVNDFISPYHFEEKPLDVFNKHLNDAGFKNFHVEVKDKVFIYDDLELLKC